MFYDGVVRCFSNKDEHLHVFKMREGKEVFYTTGIPAVDEAAARKIAEAEYAGAKIIGLCK